MAWNDPGGDGGHDPWGGRPGGKGPPDLDEVIRKLQSRFGGIFGRGGGRPRTGKGPGGGPGLWVMIAVVLALLLVWECSYIIQPAQRGVVLRFGRYVATLQPGLHIRFPRPIESVQVVDVDQIRSVSHKASMLTQDENIVDVELAVQYKVSNVKDYLFDVLGPDATLRQATESALRYVIGKNKMDFVLTEGRDAIAGETKAELDSILKRYKTGLEVTSVNMQPAKPPEQVKSAFDDAIKAREDQQRLINEAEAYRNEIIPKARGAAARIGEEAIAYKSKVIAQADGDTARFLLLMKAYEKAPAVTRERMYLDTMESVLSKSGKILMDTKNNNSLMYLPIDKLLEQQKAKQSGHSSSSNGSSSDALAPLTQDQDLRNREKARQRGAR